MWVYLGAENCYNDEVKFITSDIYKKQKLYENDIE